MTSSPIIEKLKLWLVALLVVAFIYILAYGEFSAVVQFGLALLCVLLAAAMVVFSAFGQNFYRFSREAFVELRKVVWPKKQETLQMTLVVFVFLAIMVALLSLFDFVIGAAIDAVLE